MPIETSTMTGHVTPARDRAALEAFYERHRAGRTAIAPHLQRLRELAEGCALAVEFGVKRGASSSALLLGADRVISFDLVETAEARALERIAGDAWSYRLEDSRRAQLPAADLIFFDSLHTYAQVKAELSHAAGVRRWLVFHDVLTFGVIGAKGEGGEQLWAYQRGVSVPVDALGIRPAIDEFQIAHPEWRITASYSDSHGLLVLERRP